MITRASRRTLRYAEEVTQALQTRSLELLRRNKELEQFNALAVGRELKMVELKQEINNLAIQSGAEPRYTIPEPAMQSAP